VLSWSVAEGCPESLTPRDLNKFLHRFIDDGLIHKRAILTEIRFVDALPRTSVGKIDKKLIRRDLAAEQPSSH
jgi:fatty-acyl-CoA synthase